MTMDFRAGRGAGLEAEPEQADSLLVVLMVDTASPGVARQDLRNHR
jgi:hypothetical protein